MANDRIYIKCTTCNEKTLPTKHYPSMRLGELAHSPDEISEWISTHLDHHPKRFEMFLSGVVGLSFETESAPNKRLPYWTLRLWTWLINCVGLGSRQ